MHVLVCVVVSFLANIQNFDEELTRRKYELLQAHYAERAKRVRELKGNEYAFDLPLLRQPTLACRL